MPPSLGANATEPPKKPPPSRPTGSQLKAVRKPNWLLQPKIKRFDAPNLKPGSTLPTKASLGVVRTPTISQPQPLTSERRGSTQTPTETSHTSSALEGAATLEPGSNVDVQQGSAPLLAGAQMPTVEDVPRLPPASRAEAEAFLSDLMPSESVALLSFVHLTHISPLPQDVGTHDVRFLTPEGDSTTNYSPLRDGVELNHPPAIPIRKPSVSDLLK
jgi:hypothetical protein